MSHAEVEIRVLTPSDAEAFWKLRLEGIQTEPAAFRESQKEHQSFSVEVTRDRLQPQDGDFVIGAFLDGALVGTTGFHQEQGEKVKHKALVWGVYVTPSARGSGIARLMFQELLRRAREVASVEQLNLRVAETQHAAYQLYVSLGFSSCGAEPRALKIGDEYVSEHAMVLRL